MPTRSEAREALKKAEHDMSCGDPLCWLDVLAEVVRRALEAPHIGEWHGIRTITDPFDPEEPRHD